MGKEMTKVSIPYGNKTVDVEFASKNLKTVASPKELRPEADIATLVHQASRAPIGIEPLTDLLKGSEHLLIIVDDITRPTPVDQILPIVLGELEVECKRVEVTILIALGTHRKMTLAEIQQKIGSQIAALYPVLNHDWDNDGELVELGITPNGTPIKDKQANSGSGCMPGDRGNITP